MISNLSECLCAITYRGRLEHGLEAARSELHEPHLRRTVSALEFRIAGVNREVEEFVLRTYGAGMYRVKESDLATMFFSGSLPARQVVTPPSQVSLSVTFGWANLRFQPALS